MKKIFALVLCAALMVMVAGCATQSAGTTPAASSAPASSAPSSSAPESSAPAPELTISYMSISATDMFSKAFAEYQKTHPNLKLDPVVSDAQGYAEKVMAQVRTNTVSDVTWNNCMQTVSNRQNIDANVYLDLTDIINTKFKDRFVNGTFNMATTDDGKIVCLPCEMQIQGFLVNTELFKKYNLKVPETFDDLLAAAKTFKQNGLTLFGNGTGDAWPTWGWYHWLQLWGIDDEGDQLFTNHTLKFQDSNTSKALYKLAELYAAGAFPENNSTITYEQTKTLFLSQKCAMMTTSTDWLTGIVNSDLDKSGAIQYNFGVTFPDSPVDQKQCIKMVGNGYALSASLSEEKKAALLDFFDWFYSDAGANIALADGLILPINFKPSIEVTPLTKGIIDLTQSTERKGTMTATYSFYLRWGANGDIVMPPYYCLDNMITGLVNGTVTAKELPAQCKKFDDLAATALEEFKKLKK